MLLPGIFLKTAADLNILQFLKFYLKEAVLYCNKRFVELVVALHKKLFALK